MTRQISRTLMLAAFFTLVFGVFSSKSMAQDDGGGGGDPGGGGGDLGGTCYQYGTSLGWTEERKNIITGEENYVTCHTNYYMCVGNPYDGVPLFSYSEEDICCNYNSLGNWECSGAWVPI